MDFILHITLLEMKGTGILLVNSIWLFVFLLITEVILILVDGSVIKAHIDMDHSTCVKGSDQLGSVSQVVRVHQSSQIQSKDRFIEYTGRGQWTGQLKVHVLCRSCDLSLYGVSSFPVTWLSLVFLLSKSFSCKSGGLSFWTSWEVSTTIN